MENSKIEWTTHTFNIAEGCTKVSPACANCYAERRDKMYHEGKHWGVGSSRKMMREPYWRQPLKWNAKAEAEGTRPRVFCSSLADVFEDHPDLFVPRNRLFQLIRDTPNLDWLLLTKRPENIEKLMTPVDCLWGFYGSDWDFTKLGNVWLGTTVENQEYADKRIPELLKIPAKVRFLSIEPMLGPVDFTAIGYPHPLLQYWCYNCQAKTLERCCPVCGGTGYSATDSVDWIIAGGETSQNARQSHPDWFRSLRDQCNAAGVAFHFKQWGEFNADGERVGKKNAGRLLDGRTWDELPKVA